MVFRTQLDAVTDTIKCIYCLLLLSLNSIYIHNTFGCHTQQSRITLQAKHSFAAHMWLLFISYILSIGSMGLSTLEKQVRAIEDRSYLKE